MKDNSLEQSILEVAEKLFLEKGFSLTTTTEIARQVGCNQALVHYYFRTKELLFQKVFEQKIRLLAISFFAISNEAIPFTEKLKRQIEAHYDLLKANPKLPFLIINEVTVNPQRFNMLKEKIGEVPASIMNYFEIEIKMAIERKEIRPVSSIDLLLTIVSLNAGSFLVVPVFGKALGWSDDQVSDMMAHRRTEVVEMILNSIKYR